jgi:AraC family transcriptional regulator
MFAKTLLLLAVLMLVSGLLADMKPANDQGFSITPEPREEKREAFLVAGLQVMNTMESDVMMALWGKFMGVWESIPNATGEVLYGIAFFTDNYDPETNTGYGYMAATEITSEEKLPEGVVTHKVPAAHYLVFEHRGPLKHLQESFDYIFYKYLPSSKYTALYSDVLETYGEGFDGESPDSLIEIWIPVKPLE